MSSWKVIVPETTVNLITNPSMEVATAGVPVGWSKQGSNTLAQSSAQSKFGIYSSLCTWVDDDRMLQTIPEITLTAAAHAFSAWIYINSGWDGGAIQLGTVNFTSVTTDTASTTTTTTGEWVRLEYLFTPDAGDLTGRLTVEAASSPTAGSIYVDGAQCEALAYTTTYCDGNQDGCKWAGTEHASTSTRDALSRAGGRVRDLDDDYSLSVERMVGTGMAPMENVLTNRVFTPGANFEGTIVLPRVFSLVSRVFGSSMANYHALRQAFFNDIAPDGNPNDEPVIFRYTGAAVDKEIKARYSAGLTMVGPEGFSEPVALQFVADDPYFTQIGETGGGALDTNDSATFRYVAGRVDGAWSELGPPDASGTYTNVRAIARGDDGTIYFGGDFTNFDNIAAADYIVQWDGSSYSALGSGMNNIVLSLVIKPDGNLLAGGLFTTAGGTTVRGVAEWDGSSWSALGPPSSGGQVNAVAVTADGTVYVGGTFTNWDGDANGDYFASWDGSSWSALATPSDDDVAAFAADTNGDLYVSGAFTTIGGTSTNGIVKYDGTNFTDIVASGSNPAAQVLYLTSDGQLLAGGSFTSIDGVTASRIASWNGSSWAALGGTLNNTVFAITEWRDFLIIGGRFTAFLNDHVLLWNGSVYTSLDINFPGTPNVYAAYSDGDDLYLGYDTTGTGNFAGGASITPGGNTRVYPIIEIDRSGGTTATLTNIVNETIKTYLWLDYDLQDGEKITIDIRPDRTSATSDFWGDIHPIFQGSNPSSFYLLANAANDIKAFVSTTGSPTITATIKWVESYWSID
jgi:hypothetical protein